MSWDWNFLFGLVSALAVLGPFLLLMLRRLRSLAVFSDPRLVTFLDDWCGTPSRPGFPEIPGVPQRLAAVERRLGTVEGDTSQLRRNHGSHLADAVYRLEADRTSNTDVMARLEALLSVIRTMPYPSPTITNTVVTPTEPS